MPVRDYYEVLGLSRDATPEQIKKAYRSLARKHHPDANPGDKTAEAKFKEVQNAYDILSEPEKKTRYDQFGHAAFDGSNPFGPRAGGQEWAARQGGGPGFENIDLSAFFGPNAGGGPGFPSDQDQAGGGIFEDIIARMRGGGERAGRRRGQPSTAPEPAQASLSIPFLTAVGGGETSIELERSPGHRETKVVKIPPGLESGAKIRLRGQGDPTGQSDLIITVNVEPHPYFKREDRNLSVEVPITVSEAVLGAKVDVPTLDGTTKTLTFPAGTSSGQKLRLRGQGVPASKNHPVGDLYVIARVVVPKSVDEESRKLIEQFAERNPSDPRKGLWS
jgi:DnaJ-class molecular chaperone